MYGLSMFFKFHLFYIYRSFMCWKIYFLLNLYIFRIWVNVFI